MNRRGVALLAVLWLVTGLATMALAAAVAAREAQALAGNRIAATRASWIAEGCAARQLARVDGQLRAGATWEGLLAHTEVGCGVRLRPVGATLDVNRSSAERLTRLFRQVGFPGGVGDSLTDAILDWRDPDSLPRQFGAEAAWYRAQARPGPRNGPFADARELLLVRGGELLAAYDTLIGAEPGPTAINLTPLAVVATLPGIGPEVIEWLRLRRRFESRLTTLAELGEWLSGPPRDSFDRRFPELAELATIRPAGWLLSLSAADGHPAITRTLELRLEERRGRVVVVRRRQW